MAQPSDSTLDAAAITSSIAAEATELGVAPSLGLVSMSQAIAKPARAVVFITSSRVGALRALSQSDTDFEINDGAARQSGRTIRTGIVPLALLDQVAAADGVEQITVARRLRFNLDEASAAAHLPALRAAQPDRDGSGVLVGIIDSGIDPHHPAFASRILRIWDQTLHGQGVAEGGYGVELPPSSIGGAPHAADLLTISRDEHGHGTHVAGIAAGRDVDSSGQPGPFSGVAPGADLLIVKTTMLDANIADALRYLVRVANELQRPIVINLSLGGHFDPHDGTDPLSLVVDEVSGQGRIVVVAAGNEGDDPVHAGLEMRSDGWRTCRFTVPASRTGLLVNAWYPGDHRRDVKVVSPGGSTPWVEPGSAPPAFDLPDGRVIVASGAIDVRNGDRNIIVAVVPRPGAEFVGAGQWRLRVRAADAGSGAVELWINDLTGDRRPGPTFVGPALRDGMTIGSPGAAAKAITVASYTSKTSWQAVSGQTSHVEFEPDTISVFSSEGPLRAATMPRPLLDAKPTIAAPGAMLVSARSADAEFPLPNLVDPLHVVMAGTSMAAPFVTGLVALMLQADPALDAAGAVARLRAAAAVHDGEPGTHDSKWGYGLIDASKL